MLELCIMVPVLMEKNLRQSLQRKGWGLRFLTSETLVLSQPSNGQTGPSGQRWATNHASAFSSVSNILTASMSVMPVRKDLPGPDCFILCPK